MGVTENQLIFKEKYSIGNRKCHGFGQKMCEKVNKYTKKKLSSFFPMDKLSRINGSVSTLQINKFLNLLIKRLVSHTKIDGKALEIWFIVISVLIIDPIFIRSTIAIGI